MRKVIYLFLAALVSVSLFSALVMIWYTFQMDRILALITEKEFGGFQTAEALETALVNQKGFVTYYFLDGDPEWLRQLGEYRQVFTQKLNEARSLAGDDVKQDAIERIAAEYERYISLKDQVVDHYKAGRQKEGLQLHQEARRSFFIILELCEAYKQLHINSVRQEAQTSRHRAENLRMIAGISVLSSLVLAVLLASIFIRQILVPVSRLVQRAARPEDINQSDNIVNLLSRSVQDLITDSDQAHMELKKSQENLVQVEKMALVGQLAAGMAHSIRNPFTSVKMRLFSLNRSLDLTPDQREDFHVISNEIGHIDTIVQNFLEFSRPPKLKMQDLDPSLLVDRVIQLLSHRLKSYNVNVKVIRGQSLPEIHGDPEQLKEILVNLIVNACEAMGNCGEIIIHEEVITQESIPCIAISITDSGPGVPDSLKEKIFQPFFTTKEQGTGLGLSIAARILEEHGGRLTVASKPGMGASFCITLSIKESDREHDPHNR